MLNHASQPPPVDAALTGWWARTLRRYYLGPDHPAKLRLWRWLYKASGRPGVVVHYAGSARLRLDYLDYVQSHILRFGYYEPEIWDTLAAFAVGDEVLWDIGGHVGSVAIRAALDPRVRQVHCFEPHPRTGAALRANLELNPALRVTHHAVALGDRTETRTLSAGQAANVGTASLVGNGTGGAPVQCVTADDLVAAGKAEPPTLMKLDVEGFETQVLAGAACILACGRLKAIVMEAETAPGGSMIDRGLVARLADQGYRVWRIPRPECTTEPRENYLAAPALPATLETHLAPHVA
jgi:FkbM family methyltransferase